MAAHGLRVLKGNVSPSIWAGLGLDIRGALLSSNEPKPLLLTVLYEQGHMVYGARFQQMWWAEPSCRRTGEDSLHYRVLLYTHWMSSLQAHRSALQDLQVLLAGT